MVTTQSDLHLFIYSTNSAVLETTYRISLVVHIGPPNQKYTASLVASFITPAPIELHSRQHTVVRMHSNDMNGHNLLCDARTLPEQYKGTAALFLFYSLSSFSAFSFYVFVILTVLFPFGCLYSLC